MAASATVAPAYTYATWNPDDKDAAYTLSNGDKTITRTASGNQNRSARATMPKSAGKWYVELTSSAVVGDGQVGLATPSANVLGTYPGDPVGSMLFYNYSPYRSFATPFVDTGTPLNTGLDVAAGGILMFAVDLDAGKCWIGKDGIWNGNPEAGTSPAATWTPNLELCLATRLYAQSVTQTWNFGQNAFSYTPPSGFNEGWYE
jgi:hypothetical protein